MEDQACLTAAAQASAATAAIPAYPRLPPPKTVTADFARYRLHQTVSGASSNQQPTASTPATTSARVLLI